MQNKDQLNGWFGKLLKKLITHIGKIVDDYTMGIFDLEGMANGIGAGGSEFWNRIATEEPSPQEEAVLVSWNNTKFAPFCASLTQRILNMQNSQTADEQIEIINEINKKMCAVRNYFLTNETTGLLQVGIDTRTDLIDEIFLMLISKMQPIIDALGATSTEVTISSFGNDFGNLIPQYNNIQPTICDRYSLTSGDVAPVNVTAIIQENLPVVTVNPTIPNQPAQPTNSTPSTPDDKPSPIKKILGFTGVVALLFWAFGGDDDKN